MKFNIFQKKLVKIGIVLGYLMLPITFLFCVLCVLVVGIKDTITYHTNMIGKAWEVYIAAAKFGMSINKHFMKYEDETIFELLD